MPRSTQKTALKNILSVLQFDNIPLEQTRKLLFVNSGWRLTNEGYKILSKLYMTYESINPVNDILTGKIILKMDNCVNSPWFVRGKKLIVFDQIVHFELQMVDGDMSRYVDFKSTSF